MSRTVSLISITEERLRQTFSERLRVGATAGMGGAQEIYQEVKACGDFLGFARRYAHPRSDGDRLLQACREMRPQQDSKR